MCAVNLQDKIQLSTLVAPTCLVTEGAQDANLVRKHLIVHELSAATTKCSCFGDATPQLHVLSTTALLCSCAQAMQNRNYMYANDIYLRLAIGNAPWPIGVTSVGIHERAGREKISHVMNQHGQAHIMNDEATRKFLQVGT